MSAMTGNAIPMGAGAQEVDMADSATQRDRQGSINESTFGQIGAMHSEAERDCNFLSEALRMAEARREVLGAALERLNAPQTATSLRP